MNNSALSHSGLKQTLRFINLATGLAVLCLGVIVIIGWHVGNRALVQVLPTFVPMQYNTALGFVFCGAGLLLLTFRQQWGAAIAGWLALLIGALTLVEYVGGLDLVIDELFMKHDITVKTSHPGRMAPNTAICFTLTGLALAVPLGRWWTSRRTAVTVVLASLSFGLGMVALSGYFTELETAYGWGNLTRMAVNTSVGFVLVSIGLLCLTWSDEVDDDTWLPHWMPVPTAVAILTATLCFWQALVAASERISRRYEELSSLSNLATLMLIVGIFLAIAMALVAYLAQKSSQHAREVNRANLALQEEVKTRQEAERALQAHRDNLEQLVAERTRELDQARIEAEAANRAKSDFLSHMSHELRTPLNGILGYAQILGRDPKATEAQRGNLQAIVNCGDHLLALINDVLDLSKIEAGRLDVDNAPFDLHKLINGVGEIVNTRAASKGIAFHVDISPEVPRAIITDAAKLRQILVNLLGNAVKFTNQGHVTLRVAETPPGSLRLQVSDTGVGIAPDEMTDIFDPFKQVEAGKAAGGTGLGLAITKRMADALEAVVDVESEVSKGSAFTVTLPLVEAATDDWEVLPEDTGELGEHLVLADGVDCTILIADDRDTNRNVLHGMLDAAGFKTRLATDGDEALELLRTHRDFDLVLMDVRMPRISGLEALKQIREDETLRTLKVIAVTASVFPEFRKKAIEAGFDDFLAKPFRAEELMGKLKKHLPIEFAAGSAQLEVAPQQATIDRGTSGVGAVPAEIVRRLRSALKIKNLTAIKAIADELSAEPTTSATGRDVAKLARAFDFPRLTSLVDDLETTDGSN